MVDASRGVTPTGGQVDPDRISGQTLTAIYLKKNEKKSMISLRINHIIEFFREISISRDLNLSLSLQTSANQRKITDIHLLTKVKKRWLREIVPENHHKIPQNILRV